MNGAWLSHGVGSLLLSPPLRPALRRFLRERPTIVYFHGLRSSHFPHLCDQDLPSFERELDVLAQIFQLVPLETVLEFNGSAAPMERPVAALTFDDGLDLFRCGLASLLSRRAIPATAFVTVGSLDNERLLWQHKLMLVAETVGVPTLARLFAREDPRPVVAARTFAEVLRGAAGWPLAERDQRVRRLWSTAGMPDDEVYLCKKPYLSWSELDTWVRAGQGVGLHTWSHPFCSTLDRDEVVGEIIEPARQLAARFQLGAVPFSYPFGDRLPAGLEREVGRQAGLSCMLGIRGPSQRGTHPWSLERVGGDHTAADGIFGRPLLRKLVAMRKAWS